MRARPVLIVMSLATAALIAACGGSSSASASNPPPTAPATSSTASAGTSATSTSAAETPLGPEGIPLEKGPALAPAATTSQGATVDGVQCEAQEQVAYHIHAHLQVYVNGQPRALPAAIGMVGPVSEQTPYGPFYGAQQCYYFLHTHASDGIIHIESPNERIYTLGNFFDEWNQSLSGTQVAGDKGKVNAFVDDRPWTRDPRTISLTPHESIQLDVGSPVVAPHEISWAGTNL
ncbi:MAG TPA: hypothetical protein VMA96_07450 [Solirubrobacteraceae bacterium]|nr:hypothetical protein [Solirubrobacteraceae bacterium]